MKATTALSIVKTAREAKKLTRDQLAKKIKVSPQYLAGIEGGSAAHSISDRVETALKKALGARALPHPLVDKHNAKVKQYKQQRAAFNKKPQKPTKRIAKAKPAAPTSVQGFIPGFLDTINNVRIEEMVAEMIFKRLSAQIDARLDQIFDHTKSAKVG